VDALDRELHHLRVNLLDAAPPRRRIILRELGVAADQRLHVAAPDPGRRTRLPNRATPVRRHVLEERLAFRRVDLEDLV
jgi:hypothetical protein